ncbi:MAG: energy transducer TonB [Bacteroidia bacterium]
MNPLLSDKSNLDEIVFEKRNKAYGAYAIRKSYPDNLKRSIYFTLVPMFLLFLVTVYFQSKKKIEPLAPGTHPNGKTISEREKVLKEEEVKFSNFEIVMPNLPKENFVVVADKKVIKPIQVNKVDIKPISSAGFGGVASLLTSGTGIGNPGSGTSGSSGIGNMEMPIITKPEFHTFTEIMPEFPGGIDAMQNYIQKNLSYPKWAIENGVKGKVILSFVVMPDGSIDFTEIERGIGFGCDEEALRVLREMPKWSPGIQNGKKVAVKLILPIRFDHSN